MLDCSATPPLCADLQWLKAWATQRSGIAFQLDQHYLFRSRVEGLCGDLCLSIGQLRQRVQGGDQNLALRLLDAISTNYTYFFREPRTFDLIREQVLGQLPAGTGIRIWSAAVSSGEEAYSMAILAQECLGSRAGQVRILGTDISDRQLAVAETGRYSQQQLMAVEAKRMARWFDLAPDSYAQVRDELRAMCTFRRLNLRSRPWPFRRGFHVIFLRNVLYYFDEGTRREVLDACYDAAVPGGFLVTSLTDLMTPGATRWAPVAPAIFRRGRG